MMFKILKPYVIAIIIGLIISVILKATLSPFTVSGNSMYPTYKNGQILSGEKDFTIDDIYRYDVVVFKVISKNMLGIPKKEYYIKRVIGIPGDELTVINGVVYVNGIKEINDFEPIEDEELGNLSSGSVKVDNNEFYCLGDNRNKSRDSRELGAIPYDDIVALIK